MCVPRGHGFLYPGLIHAEASVEFHHCLSYIQTHTHPRMTYSVKHTRCGLCGLDYFLPHVSFLCAGGRDT